MLRTGILPLNDQTLEVAGKPDGDHKKFLFGWHQAIKAPPDEMLCTETTTTFHLNNGNNPVEFINLFFAGPEVNSAVSLC